MTIVTGTFTVPSLNGNVGASGYLIWVPTGRYTGSGSTIIPEPFTAPLDSTGNMAQVNVDPTGATWCWKVTEQLAGIIPANVRYVQVPSTGPVAYKDLVDVDPNTLAPNPVPVGVVDAGTASSPVRFIQIRRDTAANWMSANPTLALGEEGWESDTGKMKIGDGSTHWSALAYVFAQPWIAPASNGSDDTSALNALLAAAGAGYVRGKPGQNYVISAPLVLRSGTTLDMTGCTVTLKASSNCNMVQNAAYANPNRVVSDAATTASSTTVTSATANFTSSDVGANVTVAGAGPGGGALYTTVSSVTNSTTAVLSLAATTAVTAASLTVWNRDKNIAIRGGYWDRGSNGGTNNAAHSIILRRVDGLLIKGPRGNSTGGKYLFAIGDVSDFDVDDIESPTLASDTVHMTGPCTDGVVQRIRTRSGGDDCVAFTTTDYGGYNDVNGPFTNVAVRDVTTANSTRAVLVGGSASGYDDGFGLTGITVDNIHQLGTGDGVSVGGPQSATLLGHILIRNVNGTVLLRHKTMSTVTCENTGTVTVSPESGSTVNLQRLVIKDPSPAGAIVSVNSTSITIGDIEVSGSVYTGSVAPFALLAGTIRSATIRGINYSGGSHFVAAAATITTLTLDTISGTIPSTYHLVNVTGGSIGTVNVTNPNYTAADTNSGITVKVGGAYSVGTVNILGGLLNAIGRVLDTPTGDTATLNLNLANVTLAGCNRILQVGDGTVNVSYANVAFNSGINQPFRAYGPANLNVRGSGWGGYTSGAIPAPGTGVIHVAALDLPVDLSLIGKANGDRANNTNAALACGTGPAISNGTNWKNLYSGATY